MSRFEPVLLAASAQRRWHPDRHQLPHPVHRQPAYADPRYREGDFPVAEQAAREVLSLPLFPEMTGQQISAVCTSLLEVVRVVKA